MLVAILLVILLVLLTLCLKEIDKKSFITPLPTTTIIQTTTTTIPQPEVENNEEYNYCSDDWECACGMHKETGECIVGNYNEIFTVQRPECAEFCKDKKPKLRCVNNKCVY